MNLEKPTIPPKLFLLFTSPQNTWCLDPMFLNTAD